MTRWKLNHCAFRNCKPLKNFLSRFAAMAVQSLKFNSWFLAIKSLHVTWQPEIWHIVSFDGYLQSYIVWKVSFIWPAVFELLAKKLKTWTHLPEKPLSKNKGTRSVRVQCPNYITRYNTNINYYQSQAKTEIGKRALYEGFVPIKVGPYFRKSEKLCLQNGSIHWKNTPYQILGHLNNV